MLFRDVSDRLLILSPGGVGGPPDGPDWRYQGQTWGIAVSDLDGDGRLDLYVNHHTIGPEDLIYAFAKPTASHVFLESGPGTETRDQHGATFFDIDQDGDLDLLETRGGGKDLVSDPTLTEFWNWVYLNDGSGELSEENAIEAFGELERGPGRDRAFTPMNIDGTIALFAGALGKDDGTWPSELFRREGDGVYRRWDVIATDPNDCNFAIATHLGRNDFADVVMVTAHKLTIELDVTRARSAVFSERLGRGVEDVQVADIDGDARQEVIVAMNAGPLRLFGMRGREVVDLSGEGLLPDIGGVAGVTTADLDNDGDTDIAALLSGPGAQVVTLVNDGEGVFAAEPGFAVEGLAGEAEAIVSGDFNNDGRIDLLVSSGMGDMVVPGGYGMLFGKGGDENWLSVSLESTISERNGLGARVVLETTGGGRQLLEQDSGMHVDRPDSPRLHFGLGDELVDKITVHWADGSVDVFEDVAANRHVTLAQSAADELFS